jgi:Predicted membrane protein (DUF2142)
MTAWAVRLPFLMAAGFVLLAIAWLGASPPASGPDEPSHYLRALSVGVGDFFGEPTNQQGISPQNPAQAEQLRRTTRSVAVPPGLAVPASWFCMVAEPRVSAACIGAPPTNTVAIRQPTYEAGYLPFLYVPDGLPMRLAHTAADAMTAARAVNTALTCAFLVLAIVLLWDRRSSVSLIAVPLAITPTVVFTGTVINPSGAEASAAFALMAFLLRLSRNPRQPTWFWWGGIAAGVVLSLARPLGPFWVLVLVGIGVAFGGRAAIGEALRSAPRIARIGGGLIAAAMILGLGWQLVGAPPQPHSPADLLAWLGPSLVAIPETFGEVIGVFGWQNILMPRPAYAVWGIALVALIAPALLRGRHRERRTLDLVIVGFFAAIVAVSALVELPTGFAVQGRHVLPIAMALPAISGEILYRNMARIGLRTVAGLGALVGISAAVIQFVGWYSNGHRYAVGLDGPWLFVGRAAWNPAGGWIPWMILAAAGALLLAISCVLPFWTVPGATAGERR